MVCFSNDSLWKHVHYISRFSLNQNNENKEEISGGKKRDNGRKMWHVWGNQHLIQFKKGEGGEEKKTQSYTVAFMLETFPLFYYLQPVATSHRVTEYFSDDNAATIIKAFITFVPLLSLEQKYNAVILSMLPFFFLFQHDGQPYCHKPCYAVLFGPKGNR